MGRGGACGACVKGREKKKKQKKHVSSMFHVGVWLVVAEISPYR